MELTAPPIDPLVHSWRKATLVAGAIAAFELLLLLIIAGALLGRPLSAHAKEAALTRATGIAPVHPEPKTATLSRGDTSVLVLNGNGVSGAAAAAAARVRARGYTIASTGNAGQTYGRTAVMYRPGRRPEGERLAADLGVKIVGPLDGMKVRNLLGAQAVLVVGS